MLNIIDLEKKWLKYKIKYYIPHISIAISSTIIISILTMIDFQKEDNIKKVETVEAKIDKKDEIKVIKENKTIIEPSLDFIQNYQKNKDPQKDTTTQKVKEEKITEVVVNLEPQKEYDSNKIDIQRESTQDNLEHVVQRFKKNNNPVLSLFIAKKYYELGDYKNAYQYAFLTNEINDRMEDSWIVFIKSMIKLGEKEKAVETLKRYVQHSDSPKGKMLLEEILSGRFR